MSEKNPTTPSAQSTRAVSTAGCSTIVCSPLTAFRAGLRSLTQTAEEASAQTSKPDQSVKRATGRELPPRPKDELSEYKPPVSTAQQSINDLNEREDERLNRRSSKGQSCPSCNNSRGTIVAPKSLGGDEKTLPLSTDSQ
jgi:hypothetical protein